MTQKTISVDALTKHLQSLGLRKNGKTISDKAGHFEAPSSGSGSKFVIFLPEKNRTNMEYTKKTRATFLEKELMPNLNMFKGVKFDDKNQQNSSAGQISFTGSNIFIIAKLLAMKGSGASKGAKFEENLEKDFNHYKNHTNVFIHKTFMEDDFKNKILDDAEIISVKGTGALNTKRPLKFDSSGIYCSVEGGQRTSDIGMGLADLIITIKKQNQIKEIPISAKFGKTVTFFNSGIGSQNFPPKGAFSPEEFQKGFIDSENEKGLAILDLFGLDAQKFIGVFTNYKPKFGQVLKSQKEIVEGELTPQRKKNLEEFLKTVIGQGYWLLHLDDNGSIHSFNMTEQFLAKASKITSNKLIIEYPTGGSAKRVNIKLDTELYKLTFNIRNKQAGLTYPTHIMCDYEFKH